MKIEFIKVEGGGNDFILIDRINKGKNDVDWNKVVPGMCRRQTGIGADGVLVLEKHPGCDFTMRIFNPDGQEVEMCGNGARCSAYYFSQKENLSNVKLNTIAGVMRAKLGKDKMIKLILPAPTGTELDILIKIEGKEMGVSYINTGVPHVVIETNRLEDMNVEKLGRGIRYNRRFAPHGANADFVQVIDDRSLEVRTYERGVEKETLSCGTGVVASAIVETLKGRIKPPVKVKTRGGEIMKVYFKISEEEDLISRIYDVRLEGRVNKVFEGKIDLAEI